MSIKLTARPTLPEDFAVGNIVQDAGGYNKVIERRAYLAVLVPCTAFGAETGGSAKIVDVDSVASFRQMRYFPAEPITPTEHGEIATGSVVFDGKSHYKVVGRDGYKVTLEPCNLDGWVIRPAPQKFSSIREFDARDLITRTVDLDSIESNSPIASELSDTAFDPYESHPDPYGPGPIDGDLDLDKFNLGTFDIDGFNLDDFDLTALDDFGPDRTSYVLVLPIVPSLLVGLGLFALSGIVGFIVGRRVGR